MPSAATAGRTPARATPATRVRDAGRAVINAALAVAAVRALQARGSSNAGGGTEKRATGEALGWRFGRPVVVVAGLAVVAAAAVQARKAVTRSFMKGLAVDEMAPETKRTVEMLGVAGHAARAVVYMVTGLFLVRAALHEDANEANGIDGALLRLADASYGQALLWLVAVGLVAFGLWSAVEGRYRRHTG